MSCAGLHVSRLCLNLGCTQEGLCSCCAGIGGLLVGVRIAGSLLCGCCPLYHPGCLLLDSLVCNSQLQNILDRQGDTGQ